MTPHGGRAARRRAASGKGDSVRRGVFLGGMTVAAVMSIAIVLGSGYAWYEWKDLNQNIRRVDAIPQAGPAGADGVAAPDIDGADQNILIVGNDDRDSATDAELKQLGTTRDGGSYNTDTMMILHAPADGRSATIISMPRDSWVSIPGHGKGKINSAFPDGANAAGGDKKAGFTLMVQTVQNLTGLTIDHFVQVDLLGFYRISNAIQGVRVNLCHAVKEKNSGIDLPAGPSDIQGTQALAFVRQRYGYPDGNGDFDRMKRQQYFIAAAFKGVSGSLRNPFRLKDLIDAVTSSVTMDDQLQLPKLAAQFTRLNVGSINTQTIPTNGYGTEDTQSVIEVDPAAVQEWAKQIIAAGNPTPTPAPTPTIGSVAPSTVTVDVLNGGATDGAAARNATALTATGFNVGTIGSADSGSPSTLVEYPAGMNAQAAAVAARVPGASLKQTATVSRVTLVLGLDGHSVTGVATPSPPAGGSTAPVPTVNAAATGACIN